MEDFIGFFLLVIIVFLIIFMRKINKVSESLAALKKQISNLNITDGAAELEDVPIDSREIVANLMKKRKAEKIQEELSRFLPEEVVEEKEVVLAPVDVITEPIEEPIELVAPIAAITPVYKPSFMERNPDLEKFIGENLLSKIGIVIFVIGMGFLIKLGIDSNVINEGMRVVIGVVIGGGMIGLAHYLRNSFAKFSSVLIGGALSVLYFTIALAFHEYALIPQMGAFIIMVFITAFAVLLSISYDRKSLAILAIIGGFGTPFFVSTGAGDPLALLTYILILDLGMLALVYFKKWNVINYIVYAFTYLLYASVFITQYALEDHVSAGGLFLFLTAFYLIFFVMSIIYNLKNVRKFKFAEISMLLSNSAIYFGLGLSLMSDINGGIYGGLFTGLVAVFNFGFAYKLYTRKDIDKNLLYLLIGLVLTFLTLIAPVQLKGNYITIFWALESVLLFWLAKKSGIKLMKYISVIILLLMFMSLILDWKMNYAEFDYPMLMIPFLNKAFITSFIAMSSLIAFNRLSNENIVWNLGEFQIVWRPLILKILLIIVAYFGLFFELDYQFIRAEFTYTLRNILLGVYNFLFVIALGLLPYFKKNEILKKAIAGFSILAIGSYLTIYTAQISQSRDILLTNTENISSGFYAHYVLLFLFGALVFGIYREIYKHYGFKSKEGNISLWILSIITVFVSSVEIGHLSVMTGYNAIDGVQYQAAVKNIYPIVWAIAALVLMILGMKFKLKTLRLASLVLFLVTTAKLFLYDLAGNSTGKIISFILLGVILLVISFLYQKLKFIIQDDENQD
ncbi:MAG: putative membrane protein [Cyclobacteriaceae bacterium]|jgi:uncharacterized membrane protein